MLIFALAMICLFSLQAVWLYNTYQLQLRKIEVSINSIFYQAIEKELDHRFLELGKKANRISTGSSARSASYRIDYSGIESKSVSSQQFDMVQQLMKTYNFRFNIQTVDSVFSSLLQSNHYPFHYQINYADSTNKVINTAGQTIKNGFRTDVLPIIKGENVFAVVKITPPAVLRNMLAILIVSVLIFFFIIACIIYEIEVFLNQHQINRLRRDFTHAFTHDMKTPLSSIHSILVQLENESLKNHPDLCKRLFSIAIGQALNLQTTVNQILTLAVIEKKQLLLKKESVDLPVMIQSLIDKFTINCNKEILFQTAYNLKNKTVFADSFLLNNAISNLIDNAIKYSGNSVKIEIEGAALDKQIDICVKDNGFGISSNDQIKIFKQFERGTEIKQNQAGGFGIGLNYVQQVIEAHGGSVSVSSREGFGSEFIITLPLQYI